MNHNDFYENLEFAQNGEACVASLLCGRFKDFKLVGYNDDNKYDIVASVGDKMVNIEVKEDVRIKDTGNVVIESESWGKPSGIMTTQSDFWIFRWHLGDSIQHWLYRTSNIKEAITDVAYYNRRKMTHTDSKNRLYFFKLDKFLTYALLRLDYENGKTDQR